MKQLACSVALVVGRLGVATVAVLIFLNGFLAATPVSAQVQGDVYLLTQGGEVRPGAATDVWIIPVREGVGEEWGTICRRQAEESPLLPAHRRVAELEEAQLDLVKESAPPKQILRELRALRDLILDSLPEVTKTQSASRVAWVQSLALASSPTGMDAHFSFAGVPPGEYWLFAEMRLLEASHFWLVPVRLVDGEALITDLDNNNRLPIGALSCDTTFPPR
jgi:hypothetical protein